MRLKKTLLCTSLFATSVMAASVQAATQDSLKTNVLGGPNTGITAVFTGGATMNEGANYVRYVPADVPVDIMGTIAIDPDHVGQEGDLFLAINVQGTFYQINGTTANSWDYQKSSVGLNPMTTKTLGATETISLADIEGTLGVSLDGKFVTVYMGYMSDSSNLIYSSPVRINFDTLNTGTTCPSGLGASITNPDGGKRLCVLSGTYTSDLRLVDEFEYVLSGAVFIGGDNVDNASITFDPGVKMYGESGNDFLVIRRGSTIHVNGTPSMPVIMTSANDATAGASTRGQWGGLIINGNATINGCTAGTAVCEAEGEGSTGLYGGNDDSDSSGNLNYLQVKYAGFEITPDNELNGIAFQAVGSGTIVDYVQVHNNSDDGVEFFGGTVNAKHLYLSGIGDDSVDWTRGWRGKLQHVVVMQGADTGDQGIEADNLEDARDSLPRAKPAISNITLVGTSNTDWGMLLREGTGANLSNLIAFGFGDGCIDIDHTETYTNAGASATSLTGELTITSSVVNCTTNFADEAGEPWNESDWFNGQEGNSTASLGMSTYINNAAANARPAATLSDSWFDATDYIGAVKDAASDWTAGWTYKP